LKTSNYDLTNLFHGRLILSNYDTDFYKCDIEYPIEIEATLVEVPDELLREDKYGLYIRGIDKKTNAIKDELEDEYEKALTIRLKVEKDLEPKWHIINSRQDSLTEISAYDRAKLNAFMVSDYLDGRFYWNKGSPLYSLLKQGVNVDISEKDTVLIDTIRNAKDTIDSYSFEQFQKVMDILKSKTKELGIKLSDVSNSIDFKDIFIKEGKISLHDEKIPLRLKGKGTKRLVSMALQTALAESGGIILIDEIEQGLEPNAFYCGNDVPEQDSKDYFPFIIEKAFELVQFLQIVQFYRRILKREL